LDTPLRLAEFVAMQALVQDNAFGQLSPKSADHHIQHIYGKTGVSRRAAAPLSAMQHGVVR